MPFYQFTLPTGSPATRHKAELAAAFTKVHTVVTGAPAEYVNCSFVEVSAESLFVADDVVHAGRMVGLIRQGRSEQTKRELLTGLAQAWVSVTGERLQDLALFLYEIPGYQAMEHGMLLPEAS